MFFQIKLYGTEFSLNCVLYLFGRCIDILLTALTRRVKKQTDFEHKIHYKDSNTMHILSLFKSYFNTDHICAIIGFKLDYFASKANTQKRYPDTPESLMKVVAILLKEKVIEFDALSQYVSIYLSHYVLCFFSFGLIL